MRRPPGKVIGLCPKIDPPVSQLVRDFDEITRWVKWRIIASRVGSSQCVGYLHRTAVDFAQQSKIAKCEGQRLWAMVLAEQALYYEKQAAEFFKSDPDVEPTRAILHRSAATLAMWAGNPEEAKALIINGLSGYPPREIARELTDLYFEVMGEIGKGWCKS